MGRAVGGLFRYLVVMGALIGLVWCAVSVEFAGKTPYGHLRVWGKQPWVLSASKWVRDFAEDAHAWWDKWRASLDEPAVAEAPPNRAVEAPAPENRKPARLRRLRRAAKALKPADRGQGRAGRVEERLSLEQKKALDELVTTRLAHDR